jgi:predicted transcriptional regulator
LTPPYHERAGILKLVERKPRDTRTISHEIETSYENTKKHLVKLLSIGLIKREAGVGKPGSIHGYREP